jgi:SAM-dependent methyltransferase
VTEWYEHWFGEEYLELYPHRDDEDAEHAVALLAARGFVAPDEPVLDLACGPGRHAAALRRRSGRVVGLDLSLPLLRAAQRRGLGALVRGDMRALPLRTACFGAVVNLFTSFGYFDADAQHAAVLSEVARVLRQGGVFALDFLNPAFVRRTLVPQDERRLGSRVIVQERRLSEDGRFVIKTIHVGGEGRSFVERVRLYEHQELERMLCAAGLAPEATFGDYDGSPHGPESARTFVVARRA